MAEWIVYGRPACELCTAFMAELADLLGARSANVRVVNIDEDDALIRRYFDRIPVLEVDGRLVCQYRLDGESVKKVMGEG